MGGAGAVAAATLAAGLAIEASGRVLGTATPPFVATFAPAAHWPAVLAAAALAGAVAGGPRLVRTPRSPVAFAAVVLVLALGLALVLNAARTGSSQWSAVFDTGPAGSFEAKNEYLPGLPALSLGVHPFLDRFAELVPALPVNVAGHPPGLLLLLHATGIGSPGAMAALCIACAAAVAPLTYTLARTCAAGEAKARVAALLATFSPALLLFGTTSADAVYAAAGTLTAALLVARRRWVRVAGCAALAGVALGSWALLAIGAWASIFVLRREGPRSACVLAAGCAVAVLALDGTLAGLYGYDPIGTLQATGTVYHNSLAEIRPYAFWVIGSPVAWGVTAGLPIAAAALVALVRRNTAAIAVFAVVLVASLAGFTKAETERIWLPFVPLVCVAAAEVLPARGLRVVLGVLAAQALATELLFATVW